MNTQFHAAELGARRFGWVNWLGLYTLTKRETARFLKVWTQTVLAPLVTAGLFLAIFSLALGKARPDVMGVPFIQFLMPGILMMTIVQNAFANTSSSMVISKVQGNIVDTLMPPLSALELTIGYVVGGVLRGLFVAVAIVLIMVFVMNTPIQHPLWLLVFVLMGGAILGGIGLMAGIYSNKFDTMAAITNFIVIPLSFLSGTFYSISDLPPVMQALSHANPVFYLIDGARYGVIGRSDSSPWLGLLVCAAVTAVVFLGCWAMFRRGYRLKA